MRSRRMSLHLHAAVTAVIAVGAALTASPSAPTANAMGCNDIEVVFARGTGELPGLGRVGDAFVDDLRARVGNRSVGAYGVNYPASYDFLTAADGANDVSAYIQNVINTCPDTRLVLGGYSQGAGVIDIITSVPFPAIGFTNPLPPDVANRVAGLAVFGNPTAKLGLPLTSSPVYGTRAIDLCNAGDPVCSDGNNVPAHRSYGPDGLTNQAAAFVASLL
ncbi:cutinase family protein [Mycolicibacterium sp.]|uniref:cutinase family protein n=1 Tax=Mycolicibacterium sp. TaxID=2320850 RepID=UPI001A289348|nr:cutinase family protein [Mycolicibacterium sp.]MBJ7401162.1 cutinase family protein [Mycolicibacterium sp.]